MATFLKACREAAAYMDGCTRHVNAHIIPSNDNGYPELDARGYTVSDWYVDGLTVRSFVNGVERNGAYVPPQSY